MPFKPAITRRLTRKLAAGALGSIGAVSLVSGAPRLGFDVTVNIAVGGSGTDNWNAGGGGVPGVAYCAGPGSPKKGGVCGSRLGIPFGVT